MRIECPAEGCGHRFDDRNRASLITALAADTSAVEVNTRQESATTCPACGASIQFGLLMPDDDGVWRVSRFAGHAEDVTVISPPGGGVAYGPQEAATIPGPADGSPATRVPSRHLSDNECKLRERALAALEGRAPGVSPAAQIDAVELALDTGVLQGDEAVAARAWRERRLR